MPVLVYAGTKCIGASVAVGYNIANKQVLNVFPCYGTVAVAQLLVAWVWLLPQFALGIRQASLSLALSLSLSLSSSLPGCGSALSLPSRHATSI